MSTITDTPITPPAAPKSWSPGRIVLLVVAVASLLGGTTALIGGGALIAADNSWRDDGYLTSDTARLKADGYAVASESIELGGLDEDWVLGRARVRVTTDGTAPVFVGVARADDAEAYLARVEHATVTEIDDPATAYDRHPGTAPAVAPGDADFWVEEATGTGTQSIDWSLDDRPGRWTVVVMNADGTAGVDVDADVGATVPILDEVTAGLLVVGTLFVLTGAGVLVGLRVTRRRNTEGDNR